MRHDSEGMKDTQLIYNNKAQFLKAPLFNKMIDDAISLIYRYISKTKVNCLSFLITFSMVQTATWLPLDIGILPWLP